MNFCSINHLFLDWIYLQQFLLFLSAILSIYFYNINVNLKFRLNLTEKTFQQLEVANADFRNQLYKILDLRNLAEFTAKQNLISEKNPAYLEHKSLAAR